MDMVRIQRDVDKWCARNGVALDPDAKGDLVETIGELEDKASSDGWAEGHGEGVSEGESGAEDLAAIQVEEFCEQIEAALRLIDTDRSAAKVYLDRAYNGLSFALPKKDCQPCLV